MVMVRKAFAAKVVDEMAQSEQTAGWMMANRKVNDEKANTGMVVDSWERNVARATADCTIGGKASAGTLAGKTAAGGSFAGRTVAAGTVAGDTRSQHPNKRVQKSF